MESSKKMLALTVKHGEGFDIGGSRVVIQAYRGNAVKVYVQNDGLTLIERIKLKDGGTDIFNPVHTQRARSASRD